MMMSCWQASHSLILHFRPPVVSDPAALTCPAITSCRSPDFPRPLHPIISPSVLIPVQFHSLSARLSKSNQTNKVYSYSTFKNNRRKCEWMGNIWLKAPDISIFLNHVFTVHCREYQLNCCWVVWIKNSVYLFLQINRLNNNTLFLIGFREGMWEQSKTNCPQAETADPSANRAQHSTTTEILWTQHLCINQ